MALNLQYEEIGKGFVAQYYALFDDSVRRPGLVNLYNAELSFMTFEGQQIQGAAKILEKLQSLTFQSISRVFTAIDSQPMFDGGVLINVLGRLQKLQMQLQDSINRSRGTLPSTHLRSNKTKLGIQTLLKKGQRSATITIRNQTHHSIMNYHRIYQCDDDPPHAYSQTFVLKPIGASFYCAHDIFRLNIHNSA